MAIVDFEKPIRFSVSFARDDEACSLFKYVENDDDDDDDDDGGVTVAPAA